MLLEEGRFIFLQENSKKFAYDCMLNASGNSQLSRLKNTLLQVTERLESLEQSDCEGERLSERFFSTNMIMANSRKRLVQTF